MDQLAKFKIDRITNWFEIQVRMLQFICPDYAQGIAYLVSDFEKSALFLGGVNTGSKPRYTSSEVENTSSEPRHTDSELVIIDSEPLHTSSEVVIIDSEPRNTSSELVNTMIQFFQRGF